MFEPNFGTFEKNTLVWGNGECTFLYIRGTNCNRRLFSSFKYCMQFRIVLEGGGDNTDLILATVPIAYRTFLIMFVYMHAMDENRNDKPMSLIRKL